MSALLYSMVTAVLGRHVLAQAGTTIANDPGDPLLTAAILHWNAHHLPFTDAWWQFPIFHPTRDTLAFSEHLLGLYPIASPIAWISGNPLLAYNLTVLLTFPLAALAMYALVSSLGASARAAEGGSGPAAGAFLAGLAYGFAPYRISTLPHVQMLASFWAPLALLGLHAYLSTGRRRWLVLFAAAWLLQAASNWYALVFLSVLVALWVLWFVVTQRKWRALGAVAAATAAAALPLVPILYRYVTVHAYHGFERSLDEMRAYSADMAAVLCAPSALSVWGWIRVACRAEGELFPGVMTFALFAAALAWTLARPGAAPDGRRPARHPIGKLIQRALLLIALLFAVIVASVLVVGPWAIDVGIARVSASEVDKPLLVALAAAVLAVLVSLGAHAFRPGPSRVIGFYLFATVATWSLALGPTLTIMGELSGRPGPFVLLQFLPGIGGLRVPARFWLMTTLCLAVVAGLFTQRLLRHRSVTVSRAAIGVLTIALLADGWAAPTPAQPPPVPVPSPQGLYGQVVLQLPVDPFPDMAATWRAVTGGWRAVNGYSGYVPNYYAALHTAARVGDTAMLAPFRRDGELHVIVSDDAAAARDAVARQPGVVMTARRNGLTQYRLPRRSESTVPPLGERRRIVGATSTCGSAGVRAVFDEDDRSRWECLQPEQHALVLDLGSPASVGGIVYSQGPYAWMVPVRLEIDTSTDAVTWSPARHGSVLGELIAGGLASPRSLRAELPFPPRQARYLRVRPVAPPGEFAWFVSELEVRAP